MKKLILDLAVSLDGFIEGPNGEIDWCSMDGESDFLDFLDDIDTIFYGRVSYDLWGNYQPGPEVPDMWRKAYERIHQKEKYVFSSSPKPSEGNEHYISENIGENIDRIRQQPGKNIWLYGGGKLITSLMNMNFVDVYRLAVHPVILGGGIPLFKNIQQRINLKLVKTKPSPGAILLQYEK